MNIATPLYIHLVWQHWWRVPLRYRRYFVNKNITNVYIFKIQHIQKKMSTHCQVEPEEIWLNIWFFFLLCNKSRKVSGVYTVEVRFFIEAHITFWQRIKWSILWKVNFKTTFMPFSKENILIFFISLITWVIEQLRNAWKLCQVSYITKIN